MQVATLKRHLSIYLHLHTCTIKILNYLLSFLSNLKFLLHPFSDFTTKDLHLLAFTKKYDVSKKFILSLVNILIIHNSYRQFLHNEVLSLYFILITAIWSADICKQPKIWIFKMFFICLTHILPPVKF